MRIYLKGLLAFFATFAALLLLHLPLLRLPYFWDEAGYYVPWALDFYRAGLMIPASIPPIGHTPLVMIYLGIAWHIFGYSFLVTRSAILLLASGTVVAIYLVGLRVATREMAAWSAILLGLSPLFFAQSTLVHLDLAPALFTTLAVLFLLGDQLWLFALAASVAVLSKETSVVLLPVVWLYAWRRGCGSAAERRALLATWAPLVLPLLPLAVWALYYHHGTGFWTGNREYLSYNLYTTLSPVRVFFTLLRRAYQFFIGGFNWLLTTCALAGIWWGRKHRTPETEYGIRNSRETRNSELETPASNFDAPVASPASRTPNFLFLAAGLVTVYLLLLSVVGGAILPRYLLPVLPLFYLGAVVLLTRLPRLPARLILSATAACFVWAWFINPPYPFPFEDNLAYADFVRLHEQAARYLEAQPGQPRILTAWPATDELVKPVLGYVQRPLRVVAVQGFAPQDFANAPPESFDLLYLYSRHWELPGNWVERFPAWLRIQGQYFDYHPQVVAQALVARYHLRLLAEMERRGQWVRIYSH